MTKEEMKEELSMYFDQLESHSIGMLEFLRNLKLAKDPSGDATVSAVEMAAKVLSEMSNVRLNLEKAKRILKTRVLVRMKNK